MAVRSEPGRYLSTIHSYPHVQNVCLGPGNIRLPATDGPSRNSATHICLGGRGRKLRHNPVNTLES